MRLLFYTNLNVNVFQIVDSTLLSESYPDTARCCYYEYHYLWQVVRVLVFMCYPIRDQENSNWPIREKNSVCCDKCWQWGASFRATQAKYNQRSKWISAVSSDLTWTISPRYIALRQRIFQNRSRWRLTRKAPYQESHWWWRCCQVLLFSGNDVSSPLLVPLSTIHPQQMLTKTTIATGSSAPEIFSIHHLDTYCVKSHSPPPSSIVHKNDIKIWTPLNIQILVIRSWLSS